MADGMLSRIMAFSIAIAMKSTLSGTIVGTVSQEEIQGHRTRVVQHPLAGNMRHRRHRPGIFVRVLT